MTDLIISQIKNISIYSPSAIVHIIQNIYVTPQEKKLIGLRGIYNQKGKTNYRGVFYDELKDESTDSCITLIVPVLLRNQLTHNKTIELICYITKKAEKNGTIALQANMTDLLNQTINKYTDEEIKAIELQQRKSRIGFRDVDGFIKQCIYENRKPIIKIVIGKTAIIDDDIKHQMNEAGSLYDISFVTTLITSVDSIISTLETLNNENVDIIVISRGGGDEVEIFNKLDLVDYCLSLSPLLVTAIAHKQNVPLLEKIADKKFITPTAFGQYLKEIYNNTVEDFEASKAKVVQDVTKQLKANYDKQISNLNQQVLAEKDLKEKTIKEKDLLIIQKEQLLNSTIQTLQSDVNAKDKMLLQTKSIVDSLQTQIARKGGGNSTTIIIAVIVAVIIGIVIGMLMKT